MNILAVRLQPGNDLKQSIKRSVDENQIQAGFILTAVGSLKQAELRFANQSESTCFQEKFEIVSLVGTLSTHGLHLHISLANQQGNMIGGHLMDGCVIYTTAEIVIGESLDYRFRRKIDPQTGFQELVIDTK